MVEQHWSYMDRFQGRMIARGPTFTADGTLTGSVHILSLPDPVAARAFAFEEPCYQAGAYRDVMLRRWRTLSGGPVPQSAGAHGADQFLVVAFTAGPLTGDLDAPSHDGLILGGALHSDDGDRTLGMAALVTAAGAADAETVLPGCCVTGVEVHRWEVGGRR